MFGEFKKQNEEKLAIISFHFVPTKNEEGMFFLTRNLNTNQIKGYFLPIEDLNADFQIKKVKKEEVKYKAQGIEIGEENQLVIETGVLEEEGVFKKVKEFPTKRLRYILKPI